MKQLFLLRHAQTLPSSSSGDMERKLTPKGLQDALALGQALKNFGYMFDHILCSTAVRTRQTLEALEQSIGTQPKEFSEMIYKGGHEDLLELLQHENNAHQAILMIGHNPSIHELAAALTRDDLSPLSGRMAGGFTPGTLAVLECPLERWEDLKPGQNHLINFLEDIDYNAPATPARWT